MNLKSLLPKPIKTDDELRAAAREAAHITHQIEIAEAERDDLIAEAGKRFGGKIGTLQKQLTNVLEKIEAWSRRHRIDWKGQSRAVDGHALKFRKSPGKFKSEYADKDLVKAILGTGDEDFIRATLDVAPKLDKKACNALIESIQEFDPKADNDIEEPEESKFGKRLAALGVSVEYPETFTFVPAAAESD